MTTKLKTVPCWRFYLNYGQGWEHECTEFTRDEMKENRRAYQQNSSGILRISRGRERVTVSLAQELNLNPEKYDIAPDPS